MKRLICITGIMTVCFCQSEQSRTTGIAAFLKRGFSAKWVAMGGASVALVDDATSVYWNPAGLANDNNFQTNFSYVKENIFSGIDFHQFAISNPFPMIDKLGIGFGYSDARVKGIDLFDDQANYIGSDNFQEYIFFGGFAYDISGLKIGLSQLYYSVNNLGENKSTEDLPNKNLIVLGLRYYILNNLNIGIVIRNKAELLPNEFLEPERKIGIGYTRKRRGSEDDLINFGLDINKVEYGVLLATGVEYFPLRNVAIRTGIANVKIAGVTNDKILDYRQKFTIGIGYAYAFNDKRKIRLSVAVSQHTYPSILESFADPLSSNTIISISIE